MRLKQSRSSLSQIGGQMTLNFMNFWTQCSVKMRRTIVTKTTTMMLTRLTVTREGYSPYSYSKADPTKPFSAVIETQSHGGRVELTLSPELSRRIVEIVADEVAAAGKATAEMMVADAMLVNAPALESAVQ